MNAKIGFESRCERPLRNLVSLGGTRVFSGFGNQGIVSEDGGRTWGDPFEVLQSGESPAEGEAEVSPDPDSTAPLPGNLASVIRLSTGELGAVHRVPADLGGEYPHNKWNRMYFRISRDEGKTWSRVGDISFPIDHIENINSMIQLSTGRLVVPFNWYVADYNHPEYRGEGTGHSFCGGYGTYQGRRVLVEGHCHTPEFGAVIVYYSDDLGRTWKSSPNNLWIWPLPMEGMMGGHSALYEPVMVELKDGQLRMVCRTLMGRFYEVLSEDGGVNWSIPRPTQIASSDSPCFIRRVPSKGDLVMIWNQISGEEILRGLKRSRICVAISRDEGDTWTNFKTIDSSGLPSAGRIEPPPIRHYHSLEDVGEVPIDFGCFDYPEIVFIEDMVLFSYSVQIMKPVSEWNDQTRIQGERDVYAKINAFPVSWLYDET